MRTNTAIRSWPAIGLGIFFAAVTARVLFDDVWQGAAITTTHALSLAALVAALAAGHYTAPQWKARRYLTSIALAVLFVAATAYVVVSSGARNAEVAATKALTADASAADRVKAKADLDEAERLHKAATDAMARECASGEGTKCKGQRSTVEVTANNRAVIQERLDRLKPAAAGNAGYAHAATILAALSLGDAKAIEVRLILLMPFLVTVIAEIGTVTFLGMGFGHRERQVIAAPEKAATAPASVPTGPDSPTPSTPPTGRRGSQKKDAALVSFVQRFEAQHGRRPTVAELRAAHPQVPRTTARGYVAASRPRLVAVA